MKKLGISFILLLFIALLAACSQNGVSKDEYKQIKKGMTQSEVEKIAGAPLKKEDNGPYDRWIYKGKDGIENDATATLDFSKEKKVEFKYQTGLFKPAKVTKEKYKAQGELLEYITKFNSFVKKNKETYSLEPISVENLEKKTTAFYDGQGTTILISDPNMVDNTNHYSNKVDFNIDDNGKIKTVHYIGGDIEYPILILATLNIKKDTINKVVDSYNDRDLETMKSKKFQIDANPYVISISNGLPKTMEVSIKE